jgi:apolipoprotein N-acyltransferase
MMLWLSLIVGAALLPLTYGVNNVAIAAWIAPVFLLYFTRNAPWRVWIPALFIVQLGATAFQFRGMFPTTGAAYAMSLLLGAAVMLIPYIIDRTLRARISGLSATLAFPSAYTLLDYLNSFGPYGSWGATGYSQYGNTALLQIVSITGLWGLTFLIYWFAAVVVEVWQSGLHSPPARAAALLCALTLGLVAITGSLRLELERPTSPAVRIAALSTGARYANAPSDPRPWQRMYANHASTADYRTIRAWQRAEDDDLLARADREAHAGAKIVFWGEGNAELMQSDEGAFLERASHLAARDHIYLGMALAVYHPAAAKLLDDAFTLIEPDGRVAWTYEKSQLVPGIETSKVVPGNGELRTLDTPYGRLSAAICFDADFPQLIAQAGAKHVDILLNPSNEWRAIDPWHAQMASFRAIEQGMSVVHEASNGFSEAFDDLGTPLASADYFQTSDDAMVAQVPTTGMTTIYSRFGDWFVWLCAGTLVALTLEALLGGRRVVRQVAAS